MVLSFSFFLLEFSAKCPIDKPGLRQVKLHYKTNLPWKPEYASSYVLCNDGWWLGVGVIREGWRCWSGICRGDPSPSPNRPVWVLRDLGDVWICINDRIVRRRRRRHRITGNKWKRFKIIPNVSKNTKHVVVQASTKIKLISFVGINIFFRKLYQAE